MTPFLRCNHASRRPLDAMKSSDRMSSACGSTALTWRSAFSLGCATGASANDWPQWGGSDSSATCTRRPRACPTGSSRASSSRAPRTSTWPDHQEREVGRQARLPELRQRHRRRRQGLRRHQQRVPARPAAPGRPQHPDVFRREDRRVPLATGRAQARVRQGQRLGIPRPALLAHGRGRPRLPRHQPLRSHVPGHRGHGQRQRRPVQGRSQVRRRTRQAARRARPEGRRHHLGLRHDGRTRRLPAQRLELLRADRRRPGLRLHLQRPGLDPRQHPLAAFAQLHRAEQEDRRARRRGRRRDRPAHLPRPVELALGRHGQRQVAGLLRRRRRLPATPSTPRRSKEGDDATSSRRSGGSTAIRPSTRSRTASRSSIPAAEGPSEINATPVFYKNRVYVAIGQDPEHGEGVGRLRLHRRHQDRRHHQDRHRSGTTRASTAASPPSRSIRTPGCCSSATSPGSSIASTPRPASSTGPTT